MSYLLGLIGQNIDSKEKPADLAGLFSLFLYVVNLKELPRNIEAVLFE